MNKPLIILLSAVLIVAIVVIVGVTQSLAQETQLEVLGNGTLSEGDGLIVKLSTSDGSAISNKKVQVTVFDSKGKQVSYNSSKTANNGKASVHLKKVSAGNYTINVTFEGDKNYSAASISEKIEIVQKKVEQSNPEVQSATSTQQENYDINDMDGDGQMDIFYSESYNDAEGYVQYYTTRDGQQLNVYEDGGYIYYGSDGSVDYGYL